MLPPRYTVQPPPYHWTDDVGERSAIGSDGRSRCQLPRSVTAGHDYVSVFDRHPDRPAACLLAVTDTIWWTI